MRGFVIVVIGGLVWGCERQPTRLAPPASAPLGIETAGARLDHDIDPDDPLGLYTADSRLDALEKRVDSLFRRTLALGIADMSVSITPEEKAFQPLNIGFATVLVVTESVEPYLDGYKIKLKIGNPTSADLVNLELVCITFKNPYEELFRHRRELSDADVGIALEAGKDDATSARDSAFIPNSWRSVTNSIPGTLFAGAWTPIEFVLRQQPLRRFVVLRCVWRPSKFPCVSWPQRNGSLGPIISPRFRAPSRTLAQLDTLPRSDNIPR